MTYYTYLVSPLGKILLSSCGKFLTGLYLENQQPNYELPNYTNDLPIFKQASQQLAEYFAKKRLTFDLPLAPYGTNFQQQVWQALLKINYGQTMSYSEIANIINQPKAARAIGMANKCNPISIIIPCHRVIGANGKLTGYSGGMHNKQWLLNHEINYD